jgi:malonyl-CoA O-methyltransferase
MIRRLFESKTKVLDPCHGYGLWAETYDDRQGNALLYAEHRTVYPLVEKINVSGKRVLDAGCGTGRYIELLRQFKPGTLAGLDFAPPMIALAKAKFHDPATSLLVARIDSIPFADDSFDFVLSTLALDHLRNLSDGVQELSRVLRSQGSMIISVFHPDGARLGWQRTFTAGHGRKQTYAVKYYGHPRSEYLSEFQASSLNMEEVVEPVIDESLKPFYDKASRTDLYEQFKGFPLLLVFRLTKQ